MLIVTVIMAAVSGMPMIDPNVRPLRPSASRPVRTRPANWTTQRYSRATRIMC